jgi:hypothetical protein
MVISVYKPALIRILVIIIQICVNNVNHHVLIVKMLTLTVLHVLLQMCQYNIYKTIHVKVHATNHIKIQQMVT